MQPESHLVHSVGPYLISKPRAIHFAPTILPQDTRASPNWHGAYEIGRRIDCDYEVLLLRHKEIQYNMSYFQCL